MGIAMRRIVSVPRRFANNYAQCPTTEKLRSIPECIFRNNRKYEVTPASLQRPAALCNLWQHSSASIGAIAQSARTYFLESLPLASVHEEKWQTKFNEKDDKMTST